MVRPWKKREEIRQSLVQYMERVETFHNQAQDRLATMGERLEHARQRLETVEDRCCQLLGITVQDRDKNQPT